MKGCSASGMSLRFQVLRLFDRALGVPVSKEDSLAKIANHRKARGKTESLTVKILKSSPGMKTPVYLFQPRLIEMGVDFRGGHVAVAEKFLDHAQPGTPFEHVGGEGMAQDVG